MAAIHRMVTVPVAAACLFFAGSATIHGDDLGLRVNRQLAAARAATTKYHDVNEALADGYIDMGVNPEEGDAVEFVNFDFIDCTLDVLRPQALRYLPSGHGLRLIGVEYVIPMACAPEPPEDFLQGAGEWEQEPGQPVWTLPVFLWSGKSVEGR